MRHIVQGFGFVLAILLAAVGPSLFAGKKVHSYGVPEATPLSAEDATWVEKTTTTFCTEGSPPAVQTMAKSDNPALQVPVFIYHRITTSDKPSHEVIHPALFKKHLELIKNLGYNTISARELAAYVDGKGTLPEKPVLLTFDDGWKDIMGAAEVLNELGQKATFYIISGFFHGEMYVDEDDVRALVSNPLFEIGSHTHSHFVKFEGKINTLDLCTMAREIAVSKRILERVTMKPITSLAWPYGFNTKEAINVAGKVGYESTVLVNDDAANSPGNSPLFIRRMNIDGNCKIEDFEQMLKTKVLKECS